MGIGVGVAWGMLKWDVWRMGRGQGVDEVELMGDQRSARGFLFFLVHELLGWGCTGMYFSSLCWGCGAWFGLLESYLITILRGQKRWISITGLDDF